MVDRDERNYEVDAGGVEPGNDDSATINDRKDRNPSANIYFAARLRTMQPGKLFDRTEQTAEQFLVAYRNRNYDIRDFLSYHPGGRTAFGYLRDRSLDRAFAEHPHSKSAFHLLEEFTLDSEQDAETENHKERENNIVDWNAPILWQVGGLADRYWEWVNLPVNRRVRLFQSEFLERLSLTPWYMIPIVWIPVCLYFFYNGHSYTGSTLSEASISYVIGILLWTILEYVLHRKLFHFKPPKDSTVLISLHFLIHGIHHKAPFDERRLLFPPALGLVVASILWDIYKTIFPSSTVHFIAAGTTTGYICYDLMHYYLHYGAPKAGSYLYTMKRSHNYHHFLHHDRGFGISSTLWDHAFGTSIRLRRLKKPIEW